MQPLQGTVLNRIEPGKTPVFIVSPNFQDGNALAYLLSNTLVQTGSGYDPEDLDSNYSYFLNEQSAKILEAISHNNFHRIEEQRDELKADAYALLGITIENKKDQDEDKLKNNALDKPVSDKKNSEEQSEKIRTTLKFIFDLNFANKRLLGLQLDYKTFIDHKVSSLFPHAFYIFLYGTEINVNSSNKNYPQDICDFHKSHPESSVALHVTNAIYTPEFIIDVLPVSKEIKLKPINYRGISHYQKGNYNFQPDPENPAVKYFDEHNPILISNKWFSGSDIAVIIILNEHSNKKALRDKISRYIHTFIETPAIHVICKDDLERHQAETIINQISTNIPIRITTCFSNNSTSINDIIHASTCDYVIIDDVQQSFSIAKSLIALRNNTAAHISIGLFELHKIDNHATSLLRVNDILSIHSVINNIIFPKSIWKAASGFDEQLDHYLAAWDFAIRILHKTNTVAIQNDSAINKPTLEYRDVQSKMLPFEGYRAIVDKHKELFEKHVLAIVKSYSEHQYLPQQQILRLNEKIDSMKSLLSHSKYELKSVGDLNIQLQQQIQVIENRWYFKLARKIGKLKKIFFKESASNKTGILKFLKFIVFAFTKPGFRIFRKVIKGGFKKLYLIIEDRPVKIVYLDAGANTDHGIQTYNDWILKKLDPEVLRKDFETISKDLDVSPKISIVMPVYNPPVNFLKEAIESVINQSYKNWELCIADDCSPNPQISKILNAYAIKDSRIKVNIREENGHISAASNSALALATGDYILFMDHDDLLTHNCCIEVVKYINQNPEKNDIIYSDEDKIDNHNVHSVPHFKPDWAPDSLLSRNYFGHVVVMRKELVDSVGGFRLGFEGSQDYDIILRTTELTAKIGHIPKVLYHWRIHDKSAAQGEDVKPYAYIAAKKALEEALIRRNTPGEVQYLAGLRGYRIIYDLVKPGKVSVIIPTKDQVKLLKNTVDSIIDKTSYTDYEIIVLNNNSNTKEFFEFADEYTKMHPTIFRCIDANFPFNFSKLMNIGVKESTGQYVLLLNNDVEVIDGDWMSTMVSYSQHEKTGIVGAKLLYPDDTIQHAGVLVGLGGVAGHAFTHFHKDDAGYFNYIQSLGNYSALTAACIMTRKSVYIEVGGMDETFEVEYNDVDFCLKIMDRGYYNVYVPDVVLYHFESATRGHPHQNKESYARHVKEVNLFKEKWAHYIENDPYYNPNFNRGVHDFSMDFSK